MRAFGKKPDCKGSWGAIDLDNPITAQCLARHFRLALLEAAYVLKIYNKDWTKGMDWKRFEEKLRLSAGE